MKLEYVALTGVKIWGILLMKQNMSGGTENI